MKSKLKSLEIKILNQISEYRTTGPTPVWLDSEIISLFSKGNVFKSVLIWLILVNLKRKKYIVWTSRGFLIKTKEGALYENE